MALKNQSFEYPYHEDEEHSTVKVAEGWTYWASDGKPPERDGPCQLPEYKPLPKSEDVHRVYEGNVAQCWFIRWKIMDAGIYQRVDSVAGADYQFSIMCQAWCSDKNDPRVSDGELNVQIGIDPTGGTDPFAPSVVYSDWKWVGPEYERYLSPRVQAKGAKLTVFVRAWNKWELSHNDIYVDSAQLTRYGGTEPPDGGDIDYSAIRQIVREELDRTVWKGGAGGP